MTAGQYELERVGAENQRSQSGLDLGVIDHYNGTRRSVKTLSGGESFKASLALALGLSDEVQSAAGGIRLDTLFLDEGFGSLDDESLEQAIRVLAGLTEGDRLVGIISHVAALKERIDKQVVVKKGPQPGGARWRSLCDCFPSLPHRLPSQGRVFQKVFCLLRRAGGIERLVFRDVRLGGSRPLPVAGHPDRSRCLPVPHGVLAHPPAVGFIERPEPVGLSLRSALPDKVDPGTSPSSGGQKSGSSGGGRGASAQSASPSGRTISGSESDAEPVSETESEPDTAIFAIGAWHLLFLPRSSLCQRLSAPFVPASARRWRVSSHLRAFSSRPPSIKVHAIRSIGSVKSGRFPSG